jgi:hypothetical protein
MLAEAGLCKKTGINPTGIFYLQTRKSYKDYDDEILFFINRCYESCLKQGAPHKDDRNADLQLVLNYLKIHAEGREIYIGSYLAKLEEDMGSQPKMQVQDIKTPTPQPSAIVCIDEARQLIGKVDSEYPQFRCFRKALAYCWGTARLKGTRNWYNPDRNYFALLLDTSSRVSNFAPRSKRTQT